MLPAIFYRNSLRKGCLGGWQRKICWIIKITIPQQIPFFIVYRIKYERIQWALSNYGLGKYLNEEFSLRFDEKRFPAFFPKRYLYCLKCENYDDVNFFFSSFVINQITSHSKCVIIRKKSRRNSRVINWFLRTLIVDLLKVKWSVCHSGFVK